jgi:hypothetical protein
MEILLALLVALGLGALISGGSDDDPDTPSPDTRRLMTMIPLWAPMVMTPLF